ncbi:MAG: hypothetical protein ABI895_15025 [Deltaproteobacteria bacterium]
MSWALLAPLRARGAEPTISSAWFATAVQHAVSLSAALLSACIGTSDAARAPPGAVACLAPRRRRGPARRQQPTNFITRYAFERRAAAVAVTAPPTTAYWRSAKSASASALGASGAGARRGGVG